jgi:hypothetical protein
MNNDCCDLLHSMLALPQTNLLYTFGGCMPSSWTYLHYVCNPGFEGYGSGIIARTRARLDMVPASGTIINHNTHHIL